MKRDLNKLANETFDLLVIGGGIHGATIAWDAALRGLSVALVDRGDFGNATSANSLKTVHGGLRYLQDGDLHLVRTMIRERRALLTIAPHLVHPLPCVMPTYPRLKQSKTLMSVALLLNDLLAFDRNREVASYNHLPSSRVISREECLKYLPGIPQEDITGGAVWYDGQIYNTERLTLSFVFSAADRGAVVANYVEAMGLLRRGDRAIGIRARDVLEDQEFDIRATIVVNAAGPWVDLLLERWHIPNQKRRFNHSMAMNLVTRKLIPKYAAGIPTRPVNGLGARSVSKKSRLLFIAPWRGCSIVGTYHTHYHGHPDGFAAEEEDVEDFIEEINGAYPDADLKREDILFSHVGLLPELDNVSTKAVRLIREGQVIDHQRESGIDGLITVVGVKYTSARYVAQQAVDIVFRKLNRGTPKCKTQVTPLHDSKIGDFTQLLSAGKKQELIDLDDDIIQHLIYNYGSKYTRLIKLIVKDPRLGQKLDQSSLLTRAEILYGIKYEMAQKLVDVILRRTELGSAGMPSETSIRVCVEIMGNEMSWDENRKNREITELKSLYAKVNNGSQKRKVSEKV